MPKIIVSEHTFDVNDFQVLDIMIIQESETAVAVSHPWMNPDVKYDVFKVLYGFHPEGGECKKHKNSRW